MSGNRIVSAIKTAGNGSDIDFSQFDTLEGWEPTAGKLYTTTRAISARINQNYDAWPSAELKKAYKSFLGKPVFVNHVNDDPTKARGVVVAARYVENGKDKFIEVVQEVDADKFPLLAHEIITGGLDSVSMGCEAKRSVCSVCGNVSSSMFDMCSHVANYKGHMVGKKTDKGWEDVLVYETCYDINFFELSYVFDPADETAVVSNVVTAGFGETTVPDEVNTLRDESEDVDDLVDSVVSSFNHTDNLLNTPDYYDIVLEPNYRSPLIQDLVKNLTTQGGFIQVSPSILVSMVEPDYTVVLGGEKIMLSYGAYEHIVEAHESSLQDVFDFIVEGFPAKIKGEHG